MAILLALAIILAAQPAHSEQTASKDVVTPALASIRPIPRPNFDTEVLKPLRAVQAQEAAQVAAEAARQAAEAQAAQAAAQAQVAPAPIYAAPGVGGTLAAIMRCESGGNYTAQNPSSTASGAYQFLDTTWNGYGGYSRAKFAPPSVQDQYAQAVFAAQGTTPWLASRGCWGR